MCIRDRHALYSGGVTYQGETAINLATTVQDLYPGATIETTGHSLGGGLAILAASALSADSEIDVEGVVFGSLGIDEQTADAYQVPWETSDHIDHFFVEGDLVADAPSWHLAISHSHTGLVYESNRYQPARALTYELSRPPEQSWSGRDAHRMENIFTTLQHHHSELDCDCLLYTSPSPRD